MLIKGLYVRTKVPPNKIIGATIFLASEEHKYTLRAARDALARTFPRDTIDIVMTVIRRNSFTTLLWQEEQNTDFSVASFSRSYKMYQ